MDFLVILDGDADEHQSGLAREDMLRVRLMPEGMG